MSLPSPLRVVAALLGLVSGGALVACHAEPEAAQGPLPSMAPMPVEVRKLAPVPIDDFDDYLASLTSRRSITLYAQVTGYVRSIHAKPGAAVKQGAPLVEIDPAQQDATLRSLQAAVSTRRSALKFAQQNDESSKELVKAGLLGQLDYEQRHSQRAAAESDLAASEAQAQAQTELLRFYRVTAPTDGVVGDVPVKVGDYVTPQTRLTSVDQDKLIEAYLYVPPNKIPRLGPGSVIRVVGDDDKLLCEGKPTFVAPQVNVETQTVLVKTACPNNGALRTSQVLRGRVVWSRQPGVTVPIAAVVRMVGSYLAFVVERTAAGAIVHQKPIQVGAIQGNDFVVTGGLAAGDEVVVSNIQKLRDGAKVAPAPEPGATPSPTAAPTTTVAPKG